MKAALGAAALLMIAIAGEARAAERPIPPLPIAISVTSEGGAAVQTAAWVDVQIEAAEKLFGPHGIHFKRAADVALDDRNARPVTREDRDAFAAQVRRGMINVFVVASLKDVDEKDRYRFGVCWTKRSAPSARYIVLSAAAPPNVLAHELGHFLGNPHSPVKDNIMSYERSGAAVFLDLAQVKKSRETARSLLGARLLVPLS